jgi:hypothetical protein
MRTALVLVALLGWSGAAPGRWGEPAFDWWRRSVRRSLTFLSVMTVLVVAVATLGR